MKQKQSENSVFDYIVYFMMIIAVLFVIAMIITGNNDKLYFKLSLGIWVLFAVIVNDFVEPSILRKFDNMKEYKAQLYVIYAIIDAAAYAALYIFVINVSLYKEPAHYIFFICSIILFFIKSRVYKKFKSIHDNAADIAAQLGETDDDFVVNTLDEDELKVIQYRDRKKDK